LNHQFLQNAGFDSTYLVPGNLLSPEEYIRRLEKRGVFQGEDLRIRLKCGNVSEHAKEAEERAKSGEFNGDSLFAAVSIAKEHAAEMSQEKSNAAVKNAVIWQFLVQWPYWTDPLHESKSQRKVVNNAMFEGQFVPATDLRRIAYIEEGILEAARKAKAQVRH